MAYQRFLDSHSYCTYERSSSLCSYHISTVFRRLFIRHINRPQKTIHIAYHPSSDGRSYGILTVLRRPFISHINRPQKVVHMAHIESMDYGAQSEHYLPTYQSSSEGGSYHFQKRIHITYQPSSEGGSYTLHGVSQVRSIYQPSSKGDAYPFTHLSFRTQGTPYVLVFSNTHHSPIRTETEAPRAGPFISVLSRCACENTHPQPLTNPNLTL